MKLFTVIRKQKTEVGILIGEQVYPLSQLSAEVPRSVKQIISGWTDWKPRIERAVQSHKRRVLPVDEFEIGPPIPSPSKIICVGKNYAEHAAEMGGEPPDLPVIFNKFPSAIIGPEQPILLPKISDQVDYEGELVVVMGQRGRNLARSEAMQHVFGYCCGVDVTARDWQKGKPGGQWLLGKTFDTFAPTGPCLTTADEIADISNLPIQLRLNGNTMQKSNTKHLIFPVDFLVSHLSKFCTLGPGDLIFTGTPSGVGFARDPQIFLKSGDVIEVEIDGLGVLRNSVGN